MIILSARSVSKRFFIHGPDRPTTVKATLISGFRWRRHREVLWALQDVSFDLQSGQTLGIVGANGAGKSTLLRLLGGIGHPDSGSITRRGPVGALLELGAGFHPDLTGRESVRLGCVIAGLSRAEAARLTPVIAGFAEVTSFLDDPIRTYSSGMKARLSFAIAAHTDPEIVLIDEVLVVGDLAFQRRCLDRIESFKQAGAAIVLVSHDPDQVATLCDQVLWLRSGHVAAQGAPAEVTARYRAHMSERAKRSTPSDLAAVASSTGTLLTPGENRFGTQAASIRSVTIRDSDGQPCDEILSGRGLQVDLEIAVVPGLSRFHVSASLIRADGVLCFDSLTMSWGSAHASTRRILSLEVLRLDLAPGVYAVDVGTYSDDWETVYDYHSGVYPLIITGAEPTRAVTAPPMAWVESGAETSDAEAETPDFLRY